MDLKIGGSRVHGNVRVLSVDVHVLFRGKIYSEKSTEESRSTDKLLCLWPSVDLRCKS